MAITTTIGCVRNLTTSFTDVNERKQASSKSRNFLLSFSSSALTGEKIRSRAVVSDRKFRGSSSRIVSPKAVSDSSNSQTCLDPDASRVSGFDYPNAV